MFQPETELGGHRLEDSERAASCFRAPDSLGNPGRTITWAEVCYRSGGLASRSPGESFPTLGTLAEYSSG